MELLEGHPLSRFMSRKTTVEKLGSLGELVDPQAPVRALKDDWVCEIGIAVGKALDYAHQREILHRDVKPANIIITTEKHIKLLDFSIARDVNQTGGRTAAGTVFGTVQYMSPEQVMSKPLDGRTDLYSLGCTLFHFATGRVPFPDENDIKVCMDHVNELPPNPLDLNPRIRPQLAEVILQCLAKRPEDRFANAKEFVRSLNHVLRGTLTLPPSPEYQTPPPAVSRPRVQEPTPVVEAPPPPPPVEYVAPPLPPRSITPVHVPKLDLSNLDGDEPKKRVDAEASAQKKERKTLGLEEMAALAESQPTGTVPAVPENGDRRRSSSGSRAPWVETAKAPSYEPTRKSSDVFATPAKAAAPPEDDGSRKTLMLVAAGLAGLILVGGAVVLAMSSRARPRPDDVPPTPVGAAPTATPGNDVATVVPPRESPVPTPDPTPSPQPTVAAEQPLPVPTPPPIDPRARKFRLPLNEEVELRLVEILPGSFLMGSPLEEPGRREDEGPRTNVRMTMPYYIGDTEVTRLQWCAIMGGDPGAEGRDLPISGISWRQAREFCQRLSDKTGLRFTLPTEAQWEFACRAGTVAPFAFGEIVTSDLANVDGTVPYPRAPLSAARNATVATGSLAPNAWGLFDMHGNVWEYTREGYTPRLAGGDVADPTGQPLGDFIVLRGGSYADGAPTARSATRLRAETTDADPRFGFRIVAEL